jgi:hypothetical protein
VPCLYFTGGLRVTNESFSCTQSRFRFWVELGQPTVPKICKILQALPGGLITWSWCARSPDRVRPRGPWLLCFLCALVLPQPTSMVGLCGSLSRFVHTCKQGTTPFAAHVRSTVTVISNSLVRLIMFIYRTSGKDWKSMGCRIKTSCQVKSVSSFEGGTWSSFWFVFTTWILILLLQMMSFLPDCMLQVTESSRLMVWSRRTTRSYLVRMHEMFWNARRWSNTRGAGCFPLCRQLSNFCLL